MPVSSPTQWQKSVLHWVNLKVNGLPVTITRLALLALGSRQAMSQTVCRLEKQGLVRKNKLGRIQITAKGKRAIS